MLMHLAQTANNLCLMEQALANKQVSSYILPIAILSEQQ
jgi:hypothetical protein